MSESHEIRLSALRFALLSGSILLVVALRALYVGYPSYAPVLLAQLYVYAFAVVVLGLPTFFATLRRVDAKFAPLLLAAAILGGALLSQAAPTIGEPNYCGYDAEWRGFNWLPPKTFRCTSAPFEIVGALVGWWMAFYIVVAWQNWRSRTQ
jgi:hypothetical protein